MTGDSPSPPRAAARLDRLPASKWLAGVMGLLFLSWLIESYDIGLTGSVLPSLTQQFALSTSMKSFVAIAANIGIVIGIVPAGRLSDHFGRRNVLIAGTFAYAVFTFATGLVHGIDSLIALRIADGRAMGAVFPLPYIYAARSALEASGAGSLAGRTRYSRWAISSHRCSRSCSFPTSRTRMAGG